MRFAAATGVVLLLSLVTVGAAADEDDEDETRRRSGERPDDGESGPRRPGYMVTEASGDAEAHFDGRYVEFDFNWANCEIRAYEVYGRELFLRIGLPGECRPPSERDGQGSSLRVQTEEAELVIHDAPNGLINFDSDDAPIRFEWPSSILGAKKADRVELSLADLAGTLRADDEDDLEIGQASATVADDGGSFWVHPLQGGSEARTEIRNQIRQGRVAGEIDLLSEDGVLSSEVLRYEDVMIRVTPHSPSHYRFMVDANFTEGRVFVVNAGPGVFESGRIGIQYWDVEKASAPLSSPVRESDGLVDVMQISPGEPAEYWVTSDEAGKHVLVAVPHFSVHIFDVFLELRPSIGAGVALGVLAVLLAAIGMVPRRKE